MISCFPHYVRLRRGTLAFLFLTLLVTVRPLAAQSVRLDGRVEDRDGRPQAQAEVVARARHTSAEWRATTSAEGGFALAVTGAGPWTLDAHDRTGWRSGAHTVTASSAAAPLTLRLDRAAHVEQVVVTAENRPQPLAEVGKSVATVSEAEIVSRAEYSVADLLRTAAGVQVRVDGGPGHLTTLRMRGLRPDASAVLVDGLRFRDVTTLQGDATALLSGLHVVALDRVEILRGAASSIYGTNAVGGAVNLITRSGAAVNGGDAQIEGGSLGHVRARGAFNGTAADGRVRYSAGGSQINVTRGVDGHDAFRATGGQGLASIGLGAGTLATVRLFGTDDRLDLNTSPSAFAIPATNLPATGRITASTVDDVTLARYARGEAIDVGSATYLPGVDDPDDDRSLRFLTGAVRLSHHRDRLSVEARYQRLHTNRRFTTRPGGVGFQPSLESRSDYLGDADTADVLASIELGRGAFVASGYEFERERYDGRQQALGSAAAGGLDVGTTITQDAHAWVARGGYQAASGLSVALSTRVQAFRLLRPVFRFTGTAPRYTEATLTAPPTAMTGDVAVAYPIAAGTRLRVHAGTAYRAPSLYERFGGGFSSNRATGRVSFTPYGDPGLEPDRYRSVDAGLDRDWLAGRIRVRGSWFYTRIVQVTEFDFSGAIDPATDPYGRFFGYINGSGGQSRGVELEGDVRSRGLAVRGAYTFTDARTDRDLSVPGYFKPFGLAAHTFTASVVRQLGPAEIVADLVTRSGTDAALFTALGSRVYAFPARATLDLGAAWTWGQGRRRLRAYGKVDNLLDRRIYELGWQAPGATLTAGVRLLY